MQIQINTSQFALTDGIRNHIEQKVGFALSWSQDALTKIHFRLADINGPRGGADKSCQILLVLKGKKELVIEDVQTDLYQAIDRAIERASRTLSRQLARNREIDHQRMSI
jgi:putative sigma-54 modulation protein